MQKVFIFLVVLIIFTTSVLFFVRQNKPIINQNIHMEKISFETIDGVEIVGNYYKSPVVDNDKAVILLHQFGKDKTMWGDFPEMLVQAGFSVLAIDLRGHGESVKQEITDRGEDTEIAIDYKTMQPADFASMINDVESARAFLSEDYPFNQSIVGSSIGANLALLNIKGTGQNGKIVALSPGLDYKGIAIEQFLRDYRRSIGDGLPGQTMMIVSKDDDYAFKSSEQIAYILGETNVKMIVEENLGHGINMLDAKPELKQEIINFLILGRNGMGDSSNIKTNQENNMTSIPRSFELSGNTKVGEGSHWNLSIKSSDDVSFVLSGNKGNGEMVTDTQKTKISSEVFKKLFDDIAVALAGEDLGAVSDSGFKIKSEEITITGIKSESVVLFDDQPAFAKVKSILLNAGFVSGSDGSYILKDAVTTRTGE